MISAITSSATERELEKGELNTGIPAFAAVSRSTWFVPMQKHPMQSSYTGPGRVVSWTKVRRESKASQKLMSAEYGWITRCILGLSTTALGSVYYVDPHQQQP